MNSIIKKKEQVIIPITSFPCLGKVVIFDDRRYDLIVLFRETKIGTVVHSSDPGYSGWNIGDTYTNWKMDHFSLMKTGEVVELSN